MGTLSSSFVVFSKLCRLFHTQYIELRDCFRDSIILNFDRWDGAMDLSQVMDLVTAAMNRDRIIVSNEVEGDNGLQGWEYDTKCIKTEQAPS